MNPNSKKHLYDLQCKTTSKSIYLLTTEYKGTSYHYILSTNRKFYRLRKKIYIN